MAGKRSLAAASAPETESTDESKENLQQRMDEARESVSETVTEIKNTVVDEYQSVKDSISNALDWREQFRSHPVAWCIGALSVGYVIGNSLAAAFHEARHDDKLFAQLTLIGDRFTDELSRRGMSILTPVLTGTVLVPLLTSKIEELTGVDLSDLPNLLLQSDGQKSKEKQKRKKKNNKRSGKKKRKA